MKKSEFNELCVRLAHFKHLSPHWSAVLVFLINRCDGYLEQLTLGDTRTTTHLLGKTLSLLERLDAGADDTAFCKLLAQDFEGWYFSASQYGDHWSSITEDFKTFIERCPSADLIIGDHPHAECAQLHSYLNELCKLEQT